MQEKDYPALFRSADAAAARTQKTFLRVTKIQTAVLISGAAFGTAGVNSAFSAVLAAVFFLAGIGLALLTAFRRYEDSWYRCRAVAESVKTSAWRFMMRAEPYDLASDGAAQAQFRAMLRRILSEHKDLGAELGGDIAAQEQITPQMIASRKLSLEERRLHYVAHRIDEQRNWYAIKSKWNVWRATVWVSVFIGLQVIATVLVILRITAPDFQYWPVEVFAVAAASSMTWMQVKRYRELSSAYAISAHEIGVLRTELETVGTDEAFSKFVGDAENAFSREHTQWVARKDTGL